MDTHTKIGIHRGKRTKIGIQRNTAITILRSIVKNGLLYLEMCCFLSCKEDFYMKSSMGICVLYTQCVYNVILRCATVCW